MICTWFLHSSDRGATAGSGRATKRAFQYGSEPFLLEMLSVHIRDYVIGRGNPVGFPEENVAGLLFVAGRERPTVLRPTNFRNRVWNPALKGAGLSAYSPKELRRSHATLLAQLATHPVAIQGRLRHADPRWLRTATRSSTLRWTPRCHSRWRRRTEARATGVRADAARTRPVTLKTRDHREPKMAL